MRARAVPPPATYGGSQLISSELTEHLPPREPLMCTVARGREIRGGMMVEYGRSMGSKGLMCGGGDMAVLLCEPPVAKVKQCDENCGDSCDNARIYISNLPPDVTTEELQELFGGIGQVGRIKMKRGYKDQWPWNIRIYTDSSGNNKGDACLAYEDPSAAHSAGGFYNNYDMRGYRINVAMAEKSAPRAPPAQGHG
ncbi:uncharacterized protein A4U43_C05F4810 [Asparagus officinalis]|uniref:RRM domain-containing protein n=1 Tax=Asparagus officinalis TaxID=4686 RepID=A0A5P1EPE5_ASPOF|nr:uncharacterized protein A4U43_C05F4810 [Asparagus officinalis]